MNTECFDKLSRSVEKLPEAPKYGEVTTIKKDLR